MTPGSVVIGLLSVVSIAWPGTPGPAQPQGSQQASVLDLARRAAAEGRVREAIGILDRAAASGRRSAELFELRGQLALALGDSSAAERDWRRAAQLDPAAAPPRIGLGRLYLQQGLWADAMQVYREVLLRDSRNVDAILGLIDALRRSGRTVGARRLVEAAGQVTNDPRIQQRWAQVAMEAGRPEEAERALVAIAGNLEGLAKRDVMTRLAELYVSQSRYEQAMVALQEAWAIGGASEAAVTKTYDLLAEATDNLVRVRVVELEKALQQLDGDLVSREEALERAEATRERLDAIDQWADQVEAPESRKRPHADRLYAYSLVTEATHNALAYIDLGLADRRDAFATRWAAAQAEMARLAELPPTRHAPRPSR